MKKTFTSLLLILFFSSNLKAAIFTVTNTTDVATTAGSLRWCITQANLTAAKDTINFNISGTGPFTITSASNYPTISYPLVINGFSQPGAVQGQLGTGTRVMQIIIDGPGTNSVYGFQVTASNCEISGLVIQDFNVGIYFDGCSNSWIWGCYIGTNVTALSVSAATTCYDDGIRLNNNSNNNFIGTNGDGSNDANEGNCIGGNGDGGTKYYGECIAINTSGTITGDCTGNRIAGNYLGINESGTAALYTNPTVNLQRGSGVQINFSTANIIGTNADGVSDVLERNVISGNSDGGVVLSGSSGNKVKGNYIGTDKTGLVGVPNYSNGGTGIATTQIAIKSTSTNNIIGTDGDGVRDNIEGNIIGSATITSGSTSSYSDGIDITTSSTGNRVCGNYIGIGSNGTTALPILTTGSTVNDYAIYVTANNNIIGTNGDGVSDTYEANYIGNSGSAVVLDHVSGCIVAGNYIGLGSNKTTSASLGYAGVYILNSTSCRIGSSALNIDEMNYICNSSQYGVWIDDQTLKTVDKLNVRYNTIGQRPDSAAAPNAKHGIYLVGESDSDTLQYNIITANGTASATGAYAGIRIGETTSSGESRNDYIFNNTIYKNLGAGIEVVNSVSFGDRISQNSIYNNGNASNSTGKLKLGIDLNANGLTLNDLKDPDSGPNLLMNFPVITSVGSSGTGCTQVVNGTLNATVTESFIIEVFSSDVCNGDTSGIDNYLTAGSNYGEGKKYLGSTTCSTDNSGNATWSLSVSLASEVGKYLTATATQTTTTNQINSTSEFSQCFSLKSDFGDAPDTYHTLSANCGAVHMNTNTNLMIGSTVTIENDGQPSAQANLDIDDGISTFPTITNKSTTYSLSNIPITNTTGSAAKLYAWIDLNGNGSFDSTEYTFASVANGATTATLTWNLSAFTCEGTLKAGLTYLRMRLTTDALTDVSGTANVDERSYGNASNGEVEDYKMYISGYDYGDLSNLYPVASAICLEDTATAKVWAGIAKPTTECSQHYSIDATGDGNEEDGLITSIGGANTTNTWVIKLNANQANKTVYYGLWLDWDGNKTFTTTSPDAFYNGSATVNGATNKSVSVYMPAGYSNSASFRLIVSDAALTSSMYNATFVNAEVEDYALLIILNAPGNILMGSKQDVSNILKWKNTAALNVTNYVVERSTDNSTWSPIGSVVSLGNNSAMQYVYSDNHPLNQNYYRLKLLLSDNTFKYSNMVTLLDKNNAAPFIVYPNPAINNITIQTTNADYTRLKIFDVTGREELTQAINSVNTLVDISTIASGTHLIKFTSLSGKEIIQRFTKIK